MGYETFLSTAGTGGESIYGGKFAGPLLANSFTFDEFISNQDIC